MIVVTDTTTGVGYRTDSQDLLPFVEFLRIQGHKFKVWFGPRFKEEKNENL